MSSTIDTDSSATRSAITAPAVGSSGASPCAPPNSTTGSPPASPSAAARRPHQAPVGSSATIGIFALNISSAMTRAV
jgi:hypothetical protein